MEMTKSPRAMTDWLMSPLQAHTIVSNPARTTESRRYLPVILREWPVLNVGHSRRLGCSMGKGKQDRQDTRTSVLSTDFLMNTTRLLDMRVGSHVARSLPSTEPNRMADWPDWRRSSLYSPDIVHHVSSCAYHHSCTLLICISSHSRT